GVRAVQSTPIVSRSGKTLGMFSTHFRQPHRPGERELRLIDILACQAAGIIDQMRSSEKLRLSEERLRLAAKAGNIGLWDWNMVTNEVHFSPEWKEQIGYEEEEINDSFHEWESRVHPEDLQQTLQKLRTYLGDPEDHHEVEYRFLHKNGDYRWIRSIAAVTQHDNNGSPIRMYGSHVDITDRRRAEETLGRLVVARTNALRFANVELQKQIEKCKNVEIFLRLSREKLKALSAGLM